MLPDDPSETSEPERDNSGDLLEDDSEHPIESLSDVLDPRD